MILKKLIINNIRSYKDVEIEFPEGSTLLMGDIGSGKTSILLAIEFALFGLQPSQRGSSLLRNNEKQASVKLEFEVDDKEIVIERKLKKGSKTISQGEASISVNNEKLEGSVTEIKNKVLSILNYPPEFVKKINDLYKFTVYTPQEEMKQIILEPAETRLNTLRHVFGIDKYKRISENLAALGIKLRQETRLQEAQLQNIDQKTRDFEQKKQEIVEQEKQIKIIEKNIQKVKQTKEQKQKEIKELESKINEKRAIEQERAKAEIRLGNKKEQLQLAEKEIQILVRQVEEGKKFSFDQQQLETLKGHIKTKEQIKKQYDEEFLTISSRIQGRTAKRQEAEHLKTKIIGLEKCPTCLQEVNEQYKQNIIANANQEIQRIDAQNLEDEKKRQELKVKIDQSSKEIQGFQNSISELQILKVKLQNLEEKQKKIQEIEQQKIDINKNITEITKEINNFTKQITDFEKYAPVFEQKNKELQDTTSSENQLNIKKAEVNKEIQFLDQQIKTLEQEIKKLEELSKKIAHLKELESWLSTKFSLLITHTEKNVMLKLREEFSELFSKWFSTLVSDDLSVRLDETFSPIVQQQDYEIDYGFLSGGERTAVALAYRLALNQVINSLLSKIKTHGIVILDEPTDGFSETQLDKMRDVLSQLKVKQLILVSHEQKMESFVDNIIRFKKTEGITEIEKQTKTFINNDVL